MSASAKLWSKVAIAVQSALATACTITGITKANPGVVTYTGTDPANGDYIIMTVQGMFQLDGKVLRCANVNSGANTLELESEDTTLYGTFSSGSFQVITFGTTLTGTRSLTAGGGQVKFEDITTIQDDRDVQIPGNFAAATYEMTQIHDISDAGLAALIVASDNKAQRAIKFTFADSSKFLFNGYVGASGDPGGSAPGLVTTPVAFTRFGRSKNYAT